MSDRDRATIEALKIAMGQAATMLTDASTNVADLDECETEAVRFRAMSAPDWAALPLDG